MRKILLLIMLMTLVPLGAEAKKKPTAYGKGTGRVYVFGVSQALTDTVVFVTTINQVDSLDLERRTKFLPFRSEFSLQMKQYLEGQMGLKHQTSCVFYSDSRKKLSKKLYKIKKRYLDDKDKRLVMLDEERFVFKHPLDSNVKE